MAETIKKYLSTTGAERLVHNIKTQLAEGDAKALSDAKAYADSLADNYDAAGTAATKVNEIAPLVVTMPDTPWTADQWAMYYAEYQKGRTILVQGETESMPIVGFASHEDFYEIFVLDAYNEFWIRFICEEATVSNEVIRDLVMLDWQGEVDALNEKADDAISKADAAQADADAIETDMGNVDDLSTTNKTVVGAINEVLTAVGTGGTAAAVTITTDTTSEGALKSYTVKQGTTTVGVIDIPKDMVVQSGEVVVDPEGQEAGTYIKLVLANATNDEIYVNVGTLVDIYKAAANATQVQVTIDASTREISASIVAGSITSTELADGAVITAKIADGNVAKAKLSTGVQAALDKAHEHSNKELLDTYTQTETDLADAVSKKHEHSNKTVLDGITSTKVSAWDDTSDGVNIFISDYNGMTFDEAVRNFETVLHEWVTEEITPIDNRVTALESVSYVEITADEVDAMFSA